MTGRAPAEGLVVVIQARMGSSRLPGKVLADLGGRPMLDFQLARLRHLQCDHLVVATSDRPADDAVAVLATEAGAAVVRGSEDDVLGRFGLVLDRYKPATVVRLTGDCPLTDPAIVAEVIALHRSAQAAYTSNVLPRSFPKGLDVEVVEADALAAAVSEATRPDEREHVTPFLYRHPERFCLANLDSGADLGEEWWTVDSATDLAQMRQIVAQLDEPQSAGWREILAIVGRRAHTPQGEIALHVAGSSVPGEHPWRRSWRAERDGVAVGAVDVIVGDGRVERRISSTTDDEQAIVEALDRLLQGDQQAAL